MQEGDLLLESHPVGLRRLVHLGHHPEGEHETTLDPTDCRVFAERTLEYQMKRDFKMTERHCRKNLLPARCLFLIRKIFFRVVSDS